MISATKRKGTRKEGIMTREEARLAYPAMVEWADRCTEQIAVGPLASFADLDLESRIAGIGVLGGMSGDDEMVRAAALAAEVLKAL
jgi:hypothetical protein